MRSRFHHTSSLSRSEIRENSGGGALGSFFESGLPERAIFSWAKELQAGGVLLVEEVDSISTKVAAFDEYLKIAWRCFPITETNCSWAPDLPLSDGDRDFCNQTSTDHTWTPSRSNCDKRCEPGNFGDMKKM